MNVKSFGITWGFFVLARPKIHPTSLFVFLYFSLNQRLRFYMCQTIHECSLTRRHRARGGVAPPIQGPV